MSTPLAPCPICGTSSEAFTDLSGRSKVKCPTCGSTERHRAFALACRSSLAGLGVFAGKRVLMLRPDRADKALAEAFGAASITSFDVFPREKPDRIGDPSALPFSDAAFDIVVSNAFLCTVPDPAATVGEVRRVLTPEGLALFYESAAFDRATVEITDRVRQASWWGEAVLDEYGAGLRREWGFSDYDRLLGERFGVALLETVDPATGKTFYWRFGSTPRLEGAPFLTDEERGMVLAAGGDRSLRGPPPYQCSLCGETFEAVTGKDDCPSCTGPARARALAPLCERDLPGLVDPALAQRLPLLAFALDKLEWPPLSRIFRTATRVSLYGHYGRDNTIGVDARDLSRFPDASFSGVFSIGLYDYFEEHDRALAEAFRVLAPGGVFITLIQPDRLRAGDLAPVADRRMAFGYMPEGTDVPSVLVGRDWFLEALRRAGFEARMTSVFDPASGMTQCWFLGRKPVA